MLRAEMITRHGSPRWLSFELSLYSRVKANWCLSYQNRCLVYSSACNHDGATTAATTTEKERLADLHYFCFHRRWWKSKIGPSSFHAKRLSCSNLFHESLNHLSLQSVYHLYHSAQRSVNQPERIIKLTLHSLPELIWEFRAQKFGAILDCLEHTFNQSVLVHLRGRSSLPNYRTHCAYYGISFVLWSLLHVWNCYFSEAQEISQLTWAMNLIKLSSLLLSSKEVSLARTALWLSQCAPVHQSKNISIWVSYLFRKAASPAGSHNTTYDRERNHEQNTKKSDYVRCGCVEPSWWLARFLIASGGGRWTVDEFYGVIRDCLRPHRWD
jgi:hypothetical protein